MLKGVVEEVNDGSVVIKGDDGRRYTCTKPPPGAIKGATVIIHQPLDIGVAMQVELDADPVVVWPDTPEEFVDPEDW